MRSAVITIARGRHDHLRRQRAGLARSSTPPDAHMIVAMGDPALAESLERGPVPTRVLGIDAPPGEELPLAAARNAGAAAAIADGAELLVFLDVDCIPSPALMSRYAATATHPAHADALLCGPVAYLPPAGATGYDLDRLDALAAPHAARPRPVDGEVLVAEDRRLFWSLSFAVRASTWAKCGGFCAEYVGYGGEDTDFAELAHSAGIGMRWVGGATAHHQHHPVSAPPVEHVASIVRNARIFHRRWGWWPMTGWLEAFAERGLVDFDADAGWRERQGCAA